MNIDFDRLKYSLTGEYEEVMLEKQLKEKDKEIERLNNIINELEKWVKEDNTCFETQFAMGRCVNFQCILDKLQELKGSE